MFTYIPINLKHQIKTEFKTPFKNMQPLQDIQILSQEKFQRLNNIATAIKANRIPISIIAELAGIDKQVAYRIFHFPSDEQLFRLEAGVKKLIDRGTIAARPFVETATLPHNQNAHVAFEQAGCTFDEPLVTNYIDPLTQSNPSDPFNEPTPYHNLSSINTNLSPRAESMGSQLSPTITTRIAPTIAIGAPIEPSMP